ncbi:MAG: response regulator [Candidatus Xenobia bacterium]
MAAVLIVEDDPDLNEVLTYNLQRAGHSVQTAHDGTGAIRVLQNGNADIVLLDIMLPEKNGWEVCDWLESQPEHATTSVIFFTARGAREDFDLARHRPHFAGYFVKPYLVEDAVRHVERVASRYSH